MMDTSVDEFLAHYGKKGMKWGVRRSKKSKGTKGYSKDAKVAVAVRNKAKKSPAKVKALSNQEINQFLNRMSLEQRFIQATPTRGQKIKAAVKDLLGLKSNVSIADVAKFSDSDSGKAIKQGIKKARNKNKPPPA